MSRFDRFLGPTPEAALCHAILIPTTLDVLVIGIHLHSSQIPLCCRGEENIFEDCQLDT